MCGRIIRIIIIVKKKRRIAIHHRRGDVIIIIIIPVRGNGAKTISLQTTFGRFNETCPN
jgi:hypothetical protein